MYCSQCGAKNSDDSKFCEKCGAQTEEIEKVEQSKEEIKEVEKTQNKSSNVKIILAVIIIVAIIVAVIVAIIINNNDDSIEKSKTKSKAKNNKEITTNVDVVKKDKETEKPTVKATPKSTPKSTPTPKTKPTVEPTPEEVDLEEIYKIYYLNNYNNETMLLVDITNDGKDEMIVVENDGNGGHTLKVFTYTERKVKSIYENFGTDYHASGFIDMYLYKEGGKNYLLNGTSDMWQGYGSQEYEIFSLSNSGEKQILKTDKVKGSPVDDDEYDEFYSRYSKYAKQSTEIIVTSGPKGKDKVK